MKRTHHVGPIAVCIFCWSGLSAPALPPTGSTANFLEAAAQRRAMLRGERVAALYGNVLADSNQGETPEQLANRFMTESGEALGVDNLDYEELGCISIKNGKMVVCSYRQTMGGLPVYGSITRVPVLVGSPHRVGFISTRLSQPPSGGIAGTSNTTEAEAKAVVENDPLYANIDPATFSAGEELVYEAPEGGVYRAWSFTGWGGAGSLEAYRFFVDANAGNILGAVEVAAHAPVSGTVSGWATPDLRVDDGVSLEEVWLPGVIVRVVSGTGTEPCPTGVGVDQTYTCTPSPPCESQPSCAAELWNYNIEDVATPARIVSTLTGPAARVLSCENTYISTTCLGEVGSLPEFLACTQAGGGSDDLVFNAPPHSELETAQVNAYLGVNRTHDWLKQLQCDYTGMDYAPTVIVNVKQGVTDRFDAIAFFEFSTIMFWASFVNPFNGAAHHNLAVSTVITHEYAHLILFSLLEPDFHEMDTFQGAFHEGIADTVAALVWDTPLMSRDLDIPFQACSTADDCYAGQSCLNGYCAPTFRMRLHHDADPDVQFDGSNVPEWCSSPAHCHGLALSGAFWDLRERLLYCYGGETTFCSSPTECAEGGRCIDGVCHNPCASDEDCGVSSICADYDVERLFADFLFITDGRLDRSVIAEILAADDDDGNLCNDSPNKQAIIDAFGLHGWRWDNDTSCQPDASGIRVDWVGPLDESVPQLDVDYTVNTLLDPPHVTLLTTQKGTDPITDYIVGRTIEGAPGDVGRITAAWELPSDNDVTVQLGHDTDATLKVGNVGIIDIPAQSSSNWSNVVLAMDAGSVTGRVQCFADAASLGGRLSGVVSGRVGQLISEAIGTGQESPGELSVATAIGNGQIELLPSGSQIVGVLDRELRVLTDVSGTLQMSSLLRLTVNGHIRGDLILDRADGGGGLNARKAWVLADADGVDGGAITGNVAIGGVFDGNICAENLNADQPLPPNIQIADFGPTARVCGTLADTSCVATLSMPEADPEPIPKSRFISFIPGNSGTATAIRVGLTSLPDFPTYEGEHRYVVPFRDAAGNPVFNCPDAAPTFPDYICATLACDPEYVDWGTVTGGGVLYVTGPEIVPDSEYHIQLLAGSCTANWANYSAALAVQTATWGDVVGPVNGPPDGKADVLDIGEQVDKVKGLATAFIEPRLWHKGVNPRPDLDPINVLDIGFVVDAVRGEPFPFDPFAACKCPSSELCSGPGATECESVCNDGTCFDPDGPGGDPGYCRDACGRCTEPE